MAEQVFNLPASTYNSARHWDFPKNAYLPVDSDLAPAGTDRFLAFIGFGSTGLVRLFFTNSQAQAASLVGQDLTTEFETSGSIKIEADGHSLTVALAGADTQEPYEWTPSNSDEVIDFFNSLASYANGALAGTLTLRDFEPVAPSFADDTGDAISGTAGTAIAAVTVPEAAGAPAPTYAASGLPGGLAFDTATRVLSGTPSAAGSGTITVTATNSEGAADWTVTYDFVSGTPTDQPVTAEGRHDTRGEATVSQELPPLPTDQTVTAEGRHETRAGKQPVSQVVPPITLADWATPAGQTDVFVAVLQAGNTPADGAVIWDQDLGRRLSSGRRSGLNGRLSL